ncbi:LLM class flavin-dependent oxidoreductase [Sinosporangium siamense]|uniref:FMN-dependent monooxygenase n=1 Tax=Sinosporangium siamense TaxID=1367973 RepID=A0A919RB16_9ACTN|nr:LLM class flavin-dependent oxidoreductase [Sinosporangium siamense]GII90598.1 FMN-dependent monooxygenase [Sinosporangium siamense]
MLKISAVLPAQLPTAACVTAARLADKAGVHRLWITENLYTRGAFALAGAMAAVTERVRLATGTVSPFLRNPAVLAMEAAAMQEISGGRFSLGLGSGPAPRLAQAGVHTEKPLSDLMEAVEVLRAVMSGGTADHHAITLEPPSPSCAGVGVYLGAIGQRMLGATGRHGDGLLISMFCPRAQVRDSIATARSSAAEAGRTPGDLDVVVYVPISASMSDPVGARRRGRAFLAENFARFHGVEAYERMLQRSPHVDHDVIAGIATAYLGGAAFEHLISDELLDDFVICGSEEQCARALGLWSAGELGVNEVALAHCGPEDGLADAIEMLGVLASAQL